MRSLRLTVIAVIAVAIIAPDLHAGGPWTQKAGKVRLTFGYSRKSSGSRWDDNKTLTTPPDSTLVGGLFHDFRYIYLSGEIGIIDDLELSGTINYLSGRERVSSDPKTKKPMPPHWEINNGFTDSWLNLKYQFLHGEYPMAVMLSTRFPDLYDEPQVVYTRYESRFFSYGATIKTPDGRDTIVKKNDTSVEATSEWRGVLKRDFGIHLLAGHSFDGKAYVQAMVAYNFRQGAFADQVIFAVDGGYNIPITSDWTVTPKVAFDYYGGLGNGGVSDSSDRFASRDARGVGTSNSGFNNAMYGRVYGSVIVGPTDGKYGLDLGVGRWIMGRGAVQYWETYAQLSYQF